MTAGHRVAGVILAAGSSRRMGDLNKLLTDVDGVPMVRRVADTAHAAGLAPLVAVVGHDAEGVRRVLTGIPLEVVENPDFAGGMGTSVARGIGAVAGRADGALVVLGDMPWVEVPHIQALMDAFAPEAGRGICVPVVDGRRGNPVLWGARYFAELRQLAGDAGARNLLALHRDDLCEVAVEGDGVLRDVDTPDALGDAGFSRR